MCVDVLCLMSKKANNLIKIIIRESKAAKVLSKQPKTFHDLTQCTAFITLCSLTIPINLTLPYSL